MGRRAKEPVRAMTDDERKYLEQMSRASSAPAVQVTRAKLLLHVAAGMGYMGSTPVQPCNDTFSALVIVGTSNSGVLTDVRDTY